MRKLAIIAAAAAATLLAGALPSSAEVVLKMASNAHRADPPKVGDQIAFDWLAEQIAKKTNGEVKLEIFWGGSLGAEAELAQSLETGAIDVLPNSGSNVANVIPEAGLLSVGYLFRDFDHYKATVADEEFFGRLQEIVRERDLGYQLVGMGATGSRNLYNRTKEVKTPEDASGLKMRVMSSPIEFRVWQTVGMLPSSIPSTEIYMALQTGVVDAAESSLPFIVSNKYYEVAPYITLTNHQISTHLYFINDRSLEKIPEQYRQIVLDLFREAGYRHIDATKKLSDEMLVELKNEPGVVVTEIDTKPFVDRLSAMQDEVAKELGTEDLLAAIRSN